MRVQRLGLRVFDCPTGTDATLGPGKASCSQDVPFRPVRSAVATFKHAKQRTLNPKP